MPSTAEGSSASQKKKSRKPKSNNRVVSQVIAAIKNTKDSEGPTMTDIVSFISTSVIKPATKRQVITALKRGVEFGILKRCKGHYLMNETDEILQNSCPKALLRPKPSRVSFSNPDRVQKRSIRFPKSAARRTKNTSKKPNRQNSDSFL